MSGIDLLVIVIYLLCLIIIGIVAKGKIKTMDDFILGGRRFSRFALVGTILATMIGSGMVLGSVGNAYRFGAEGNVVWVYGGFAVGLLFFGCIAGKVRATGKRTMAEIIASKFGNTPRLVSSIVIIGYAIALVAINIAGLRTVIVNVFGENLALSLPLSTALATLICVAYTSLGGFYAVVWTDVVQLMIMIIGIFILGPFIAVPAAGGFSEIKRTYIEIGSSITNPFLHGVSSSALGYFLAYFLTVPGDPTMPQRALAAKEGRVAQTSFYISGVIAFYFGAAIILIGGAAFVLMPNLENAEAALPLLILKYYPPVLKGICIAGIMAAVMSSFDSFLVLATTHLIYDIGQCISSDLSEEKIKNLLPVTTVIIGVTGLIIALYIRELFSYLYMVFSIVGSALVPSLLGALYFEEKITKAGIVSSIVLGTVVPALLYLTVGYEVLLGDPVFVGILCSCAALIGVSAITKEKR